MSWDAKSKAEVKSPATARRHGVMFDSIKPGRCSPKRRSRKRISEVWSKTSELTQPPLLQGEMISMGTRTPRPYGPNTWLLSPGNTSLAVLMVERPRARDSGGVGGSIWSKKPSFSSNM